MLNLNHNFNKTEVRETVLEAVKLYRDDKISEELLRALAASALALEISYSLTKKTQPKEKRFDSKLESLLKFLS
jgi:hypothetical protein